jgi:enoyl-CoA hydratase/carnithine racemase
MSNQNLVLFEKKGRIAIITINRPEKAHAFNVDMLRALHSNLIDADNDEKVRIIILKTTEKKFFSAGYDLKEAMGDRSLAAGIIEWGRKVNETMILMKKPIIAQVQGITVGFGVMLILASDLKVFADRNKEELYLKLPEIEISAFPQTGATLLPLLSFGLNYGKRLLLTADKVGLEELKNINFPARIFPIEELDSKTLAFAKELSKFQPEFLIFIKSMLTIMNKNYIKACFDLEEECSKVAYEPKRKSMKELDEFLGKLFKKYS